MVIMSAAAFVVRELMLLKTCRAEVFSNAFQTDENENAPEKQLDRLLVLIAQEDECPEVIVPEGDQGKQHEGGQQRLGERQHDAEQHQEVTGSVDVRGLP